MSSKGFVMKSHKNSPAGEPITANGGPSVMDYSIGYKDIPVGMVFRQSPQAILHLGINAEGKMDAKYDPEKLTEAALALMNEVARLQGQG